MKKTALSIALMMALPFVVQAAETDVSELMNDEVIELEDSYVRPDYVEIEQLRNTKEIIVITKEEIQNRGIRGVSDALNKVPSITVGTTGQGQIDIRGQGADVASRNIQVMVDGVPYQPITSHPTTTNFDIVPVDQIERIEVIPGGGSVLYGSGAAGGVVNITTTMKKLDAPVTSISGEINSKGGSGTASIGARLSDRITIQVDGTKSDRDLYFVDTYRNTEYISAGIRFDLTDTQTLTLRASQLNEQSRYLYNVNIDDWKEEGAQLRRDEYINGDRDQNRYTLSYTNDFSETLHFNTDLYMNDGNFVGNKENKELEEEGYGLRSTLNWQYNDYGNLLVGVNYSSQEAELEYLDYGKPKAFNYDKEVIALFLSNNIKYGNWETTQGIRRELTDWSFDKSFKKVGQVKGSSDRWNTAAELALAYHYRPTGRVFGRFELGYTVPDGLQISDEDVALIDGKYEQVLVPTSADDETYKIMELGLRDKFAFTTLGVTAWYTETDDQFGRPTLKENKKIVRKTLNMLDTKRWGVDVDAMQQFGRLTLEERYSYLKGKSDYTDGMREYIATHPLVGSGSKDPGDYITDGLQKVPEHKFTIAATYEFTDWFSANVRYTWQGKYQNVMKKKDIIGYQGDTETGDYDTLDLGVKWTPNRWIQVNAGVTNLLDEEYGQYAAETTFSPGPERAYYLNVKATY